MQDMLIVVSVVGDWSPFAWTNGGAYLTGDTYTNGVGQSAASGQAVSSDNFSRMCGDYASLGHKSIFVRVTMGTYMDYFKPTTSLCDMLTNTGEWYWHSMMAPSATSQSWGAVVGNHAALLGGWKPYGADTRTWGTFWGAPNTGGYYAEAGGCCHNAMGSDIQFWRAFSIDIMIV
jgi:hypothetical protein